MTRVAQWAIEMTERHFGGSPFKIGDRVTHIKHGLVEIVDGQYWGTYGLSNFWYWKKVLPDGKLAKYKYYGYGRSDIFPELKERTKK